MLNRSTMRRALCLLPLLSCLTFLPAAAGEGHGVTGKHAVPPVPGEVTELWEGKVLTSRFRVTICVNGRGKLRGAALLRTRSGQVDVYHLEGGVRDGHVEARHPSSGHVFSVTLYDGEARGSLRLNSGRSFDIEARRTQNVPVTEDCAPVPEDGWRVRED